MYLDNNTPGESTQPTLDDTSALTSIPSERPDTHYDHHALPHLGSAFTNFQHFDDEYSIVSAPTKPLAHPCSPLTGMIHQLKDEAGYYFSEPDHGHAFGHPIQESLPISQHQNRRSLEPRLKTLPHRSLYADSVSPSSSIENNAATPPPCCHDFDMPHYEAQSQTQRSASHQFNEGGPDTSYLFPFSTFSTQERGHTHPAYSYPYASPASAYRPAPSRRASRHPPRGHFKTETSPTDAHVGDGWRFSHERGDGAEQRSHEATPRKSEGWRYPHQYENGIEQLRTHKDASRKRADSGVDMHLTPPPLKKRRKPPKSVPIAWDPHKLGANGPGSYKFVGGTAGLSGAMIGDREQTGSVIRHGEPLRSGKGMSEAVKAHAGNGAQGSGRNVEVSFEMWNRLVAGWERTRRDVDEIVGVLKAIVSKPPENGNDM